MIGADVTGLGVTGRGVVLEDLFDLMGAGVTGLGVMGAGVMGLLVGAVVGSLVVGASSEALEKPVPDPASGRHSKPAQAQVVKSLGPAHASPAKMPQTCYRYFR